MFKKWICGFILLTAFFTLGMGNMGDNALLNIPDPGENYSVTMIDQSDVSIDLEKFSMDGHTYVTGKFGKADISVDFDRIDSISFFSGDETLKCRLFLKDAKSIEILMEKHAVCFGTSAFGNIRIELRDIKQLQIHGKVLTSD